MSYPARDSASITNRQDDQPPPVSPHGHRRTWGGLPRLLWIPIAAALLLALVIGTYRSVASTNDYTGCYEAFRHLAQTGSLAANRMERYPPTFVVLFGPLGYLPLWASALLWNSINAACLLALPFLLAKSMSVPISKQGLAWLTIIPFAWDNMMLGQTGPLLLAMAAGALLLARTGRFARSGSLIALATAIKVLPALLLPVLAGLGKAKRVLLGFAAAMALASILLVIWLGPRPALSNSIRWLTRITDERSADNMLETGQAMRHNNQSLSAVMGRTFGDISFDLKEEPVRLLSLPVYVIQAAYKIIQLGLLILWLVAALRIRRVPAGEQFWVSMFAAGCLLMLILSPLVWTHYFIWLLPALLCFTRAKKFLLGIAVVSTVGLCFPSARGLGVHLLLTLVLYVLMIWGMIRNSASSQSRIEVPGVDISV